MGGVVNFETANSSLPKTAILQLPGLNEVRVAVVGLGYVGLPVAAFVGLHFPVVGFDIDRKRVAELGRFLDRAGQISETELRTANAKFSHDVDRHCRLQFLYYSRTHPD